MPTINELIATANNYQPPQFDYMQARRNALAEQGQTLQNEFLQEQRGMARERFKWLSDDRVKELELQPIKDETEKMKYLLTIGPMITFGNYEKSRDWLVKKNGIPEMILPAAQEFVDKAKENGLDPAQLFEQWKSQALVTTDQKLREQLGMARLESAEKVAGAKIDASDRVAQSRMDAYKDRQDLFFKHQKDIEDLRAQHRKELEDTKGAAREGKDLTSKQREARITIQSLFGMNEFNRVDEATSDKAGMALEEASKMLSDDPDIDAQTAAARAKRSVDRKFKALDAIPGRQQPGILSKGNQGQTRAAIKSALESGLDTKSILLRLIEKGWSQPDAVQEIRNAASVQ